MKAIRNLYRVGGEKVKKLLRLKEQIESNVGALIG